jgi:hypothetical protein
VNKRIENPTQQFQRDTEKGLFNDMSDDDYADYVERLKQVALYWYNKADANLLELAIRFAIDIQLKGIESLQHVFDMSRYDRVKVSAEDITDEEVAAYMDEIVPEDDKFAERGTDVAGNREFNLYGSDEEDDFHYFDELDKAESEAAVEDKIEEIIQADKENDSIEDFDTGVNDFTGGFDAESETSEETSEDSEAEPAQEDEQDESDVTDDGENGEV